jgi:hypothetical protein
MSKIPQVQIVNAETGEEIIRDATPDEIKQIEKDAAEFAEQRALAEAKAQAKQAVLDKLGLSAEEVSALLG